MKASDLITDANAVSFSKALASPFRHMSPADTAVWRRFLASNAIHFDHVDYDVCLGGKAVRHVRGDADERGMWQTLIAKRVDAAGWTSDVVWLCEVKPLANMAALGQALTYTYLWDQEQRSKQPARACVVAERVDEDVEPVFSAYGVWLWLVPVGADFRPSAVKLRRPSPRIW